MLPKSAIAKGKELENYIVDELRRRSLDIHASRSAGSGNGNRDKADIVTSFQVLNKNIGIEAKNHKAAHLFPWWRQTELLRPLAMLPILVVKQPGLPLGESLAVLSLYDLLDIFEALKQPKSVNPDRQLEWKLNALKNAINQLLKEIN
jgi:hypothetical protein